MKKLKLLSIAPLAALPISVMSATTENTNSQPKTKNLFEILRFNAQFEKQRASLTGLAAVLIEQAQEQQLTNIKELIEKYNAYFEEFCNKYITQDLYTKPDTVAWLSGHMSRYRFVLNALTRVLKIDDALNNRMTNATTGEETEQPASAPVENESESVNIKEFKQDIDIKIKEEILDKTISDEAINAEKATNQDHKKQDAYEKVEDKIVTIIHTSLLELLKTTDNKLFDLDSFVDKLLEENEELKNILIKLENDRESLQTDLATAQKDKESLQTSLTNAENDKKSLQTSLTTAQNDKESLQTSLTNVQNELKDEQKNNLTLKWAMTFVSILGIFSLIFLLILLLLLLKRRKKVEDKD
ncbi:hypothetical protein LAD74_00475 [Mycoplasma sp. U97]|uniref:hypothetical protein n=1 Tax=Mycoplasma tauri TaxID=547987 RepID=UPI001CBDF31C|nr:hypothetical protein [Mycoplasma tauri]MBZ4212473.1 hypothetical protein [Mycoplasma tauri]